MGVAGAIPITAGKAAGGRFVRAVGGVASVKATLLGDAITAHRLRGQ